jgi:hypothetical protein
MAGLVLHPHRYPVHGPDGNRGTDANKGQVYEGECNTTRCGSHDATFWNSATRGLYCWQCAHGINWSPSEPDLCVDYGKKPETIEEMDAISYKFGINMGWNKAAV